MSNLLKELEQQHNIQIETKEVDEQFEQSQDEYNENQDLENDLADFDKKIQTHKEAQRIQNGEYSEDDDDNEDGNSNYYKQQKSPQKSNMKQQSNYNNDDDDDEELRNIIRMKMQGGANNQAKQQKKVLFGDDPEIPPMHKAPNIEKIQQNIMTQQKAKQFSSEEYQIQEIISQGSDSLKDKKIRELAQKNRNFQVQYEREKALRIKMEKQLNQMIKDNEEVIKFREEKMGITHNDKPKLSTTKSMNQTNNLSSAQSEMSYDGMSQADVDFKKKFQQADKKVQELRVNFQNIKNELNKANRVISREIGENFNIDQALSEENGWKGRAQTIEKLKAKIRDLNGKIEMSTIYSQNSSFQQGGESQFQFQNTGHQKIDKGAAERRKELQILQDKNKKLQEDYDMVISKLKANQSRRSTLEVELKDIKAEFEKSKKVLVAKSNADDQYISALKSEYERLKKAKHDTKVIYKNQCDLEHVNPNQHEKERKQIKNLQEELNIKEGMIQELIEEKLQQDQKMQQMGITNTSQRMQKQQNQVQESPKPGSGNTQELDQKIKKLQEEIKILRKERVEFFNDSIKDKDSRLIIKDLSMQNAQLRSKVDNLQQTLAKK